MIREVRLKGLAPGGELEFDLGSGLNVITGETGAGKSVVLNGIRLAFGAKTEATHLAEGVDEAMVSVALEGPFREELFPLLAEFGIETTENEFVIVRFLARSGRSRASINGQRINLGVLAKIGDLYLDAHEQGEERFLLSPARQGDLYDATLPADAREARRELQSLTRRRGVLQNERNALEAQARERVRILERLDFECEEIDRADLAKADIEDLTVREKRLRNASRLSESCGRLLSLLDAERLDAGSAESGGGCVAGFSRVRGELSGLVRLDPSIQPLIDRFSDLYLQLQDWRSDFETFAQAIHENPLELEEVEERLDRFRRLSRKYGETVPAILEYRKTAETERAGLLAVDDRLERIRAELALIRSAMEQWAGRLQKLRQAGKSGLERKITAELRELAMPHARFEVHLAPNAETDGTPRCDQLGLERVTFRVAIHPGDPFLPVEEIASGGELSRILLALKSILARHLDAATLLFDEIDTGIGGVTARRVAARLRELGRARQVVVVTHSPLIAAQAESHLAITKSVSRTGVRVGIARLVSKEERKAELTRMLGETGEAALLHAEELLSSRPETADFS